MNLRWFSFEFNASTRKYVKPYQVKYVSSMYIWSLDYPDEHTVSTVLVVFRGECRTPVYIMIARDPLAWCV